MNPLPSARRFDKPARDSIMSAMRTGVLACLLLAAVPLAVAHDEPRGPTRPGTLVGRIIEHGPSGAPLKGVPVHLDANGTPLATSVTDSMGTFTFTAPGRLHAIYGISVELPGWEFDGQGHGLITILPDSVTRSPDYIMWPAGYFDWTTYKEFMSAHSIKLPPRPRPDIRPQARDSMLIRAYRYYQHPRGPLVLRSRIAPPDEYRKKKWPDVPEYGRYLFMGKGRCRFMDVGMSYATTGMRVWDVDSIQFGFYTKGGFYKRSPDAFSEADWSWGPCMKVFLHPAGIEIIN